MTSKERFEKEYPHKVFDASSIETGCPHEYGYIVEIEDCAETSCEDCWNREIPEEKPKYIDIVEVVRCKECEYFYAPNINPNYRCSRSGRQVLSLQFTPDDFCSYGKRREENETD